MSDPFAEGSDDSFEIIVSYIFEKCFEFCFVHSGSNMRS